MGEGNIISSRRVGERNIMSYRSEYKIGEKRTRKRNEQVVGMRVSIDKKLAFDTSSLYTICKGQYLTHASQTPRSLLQLTLLYALYMIQAGWTYTFIAKDHNLSISSLWDICRGEET